MSDSLVTLATFSTPEELHVVKSALEAAGIRALTYDEHMVGSLWHAGIALGGAKLLVEKSDLASAQELMQASQAAAAEEEILAWVCPRCGEEIDAGFAVCWSCGTGIEESIATMEPAAVGVPRSERLESEAENDRLPLSRDEAKGILSSYLIVAYGFAAILLLLTLLSEFRFGLSLVAVAVLLFTVRTVLNRLQPED